MITVVPLRPKRTSYMATHTTNIRILVVDNEALMTKVVQKYLESTGGYTVRTENNSLLAGQAALEFAPDVILLDILMPGADGLTVKNQLKSHRKTRATPVIYISAMSCKPQVMGHLSKTENGYFLSKPFLRNDLLNALQVVLEEQSAKPAEIAQEPKSQSAF